MSNPQSTVRLPLRTTMTNKWKSHALTNDLLERKTRALEGGLNKLKITTSRDQTKFTTETYRRMKEISPYSRSRPTVKSSAMKQIIKCGQCEKAEAKMKCLECTEVYCASCFSQFHLRGALRRHHCVLLSTSQRKSQSSHSDIDLRETDINKSEELLTDKPSLLLFHQSFLQWRDDNINKSKRIHQRQGLISTANDRVEYPTRLPYIDLNSSKTTSEENVLAKKLRAVNENNQESLNQQSKKTNITKKDQPKIEVMMNVQHSFSEDTNLNEPIIDTDPLNDDSSTTRAAERIELLPIEESSDTDLNLEQERPVTHVSNKSLSRPTSSAIKKDFTTSRPNSRTPFQQSLRSVLATKSTDELEAIIDSQLILSRRSSSTSEKLDQPSNELPSQTISNNIDGQSLIIDQNIIPPFDSNLNDLLRNIPPMMSVKDQSSTHAFCMNSATTTPGRISPFSFSNALLRTSRINSASSRDTGDGGFFTDVLPRQIIPSPPPPPPPPPLLECSTSNEWKHTLEDQSTEENRTIPNLVSLRKISIRSLSRSPSKHSITHEEIHHRSKSQTDPGSRSESSLSSSSLPVSVTSSKPDFDNAKAHSSATSSKEKPSSSTSILKKSSSSTKKDSNSPATTKKNSLQPTSASKDSSSATTTTKISSPTSTSKGSSSATATTKTSSTSTSKDSSSATTITKTSSPPTSTSKDSSSATTTTKTSSPPTSTSKDSSSATLTIKTPSLSTSKKTLSSPSTPIPINSITTEDKKEKTPCDTDECLPESINSLQDKNSSNEHASESVKDEIKPKLKPVLTREGYITENDLPTKKKTRRRRRTTINDAFSQFRKLEFSVGDGLKWREASMESMSSTAMRSSKQSSIVTTPQTLSPSHPINTKVAEQFNNDEGQASRTNQNVNDEEYFNQLRQELRSDMDLRGSDEDALLNEHILNILQGVQRPFITQDFTMSDTKFRDNETDNEFTIDE